MTTSNAFESVAVSKLEAPAQYPNSIHLLDGDFADASMNSSGTKITALAARMIEGAKRFDLEKTKTLGVNRRMKGVVRNPHNPPVVEDDSIIGAPWADDPETPLLDGEAWNRWKRQMHTGDYTLDADDKPVNPYMNTGLTGRGVLGLFGPNHAVDNGVLQIREIKGVPTLCALGIFRRWDDNAPAFGGGFKKYETDAEGKLVIDHEATLQSQMEEFFEEMISGSIELLPEYEGLLESNITEDINARLKARNGVPLQESLIAEIRMQAETHLKMQQVMDIDPGFLERLKETIANGRECFKGPVLNDNRNTNQAWIESELSWFLLDDKIWNYIRGENPPFDYQLSAGDDASGVVAHVINPELIKTAFASHGAMFTFMAASYLLDVQSRGLEVAPSILKQMEELADYLDKPVPSVSPAPIPAVKR